MRITNLKPLISEEAIQTRVKEMAGEISTLYKDEPLVVVCVLKGAFMFFSDLVRHLTCKPELDFVRLASYGSAAFYGASGRVQVDSSFGDITYMGEPQDGSRFTTSYGDMDITISADRALYELSAETDFGDFSVDGRDKGESYTANQGAGRRVVFETSFADTALRFE